MRGGSALNRLNYSNCMRQSYFCTEMTWLYCTGRKFKTIPEHWKNLKVCTWSTWKNKRFVYYLWVLCPVNESIINIFTVDFLCLFDIQVLNLLLQLIRLLGFEPACVKILPDTFMFLGNLGTRQWTQAL